jgi:hypothetical protein
LFAGVLTSHFFWPILFVHLLYVLLGPAWAEGRAPGQVHWQWLVVILASPLLAVAMFQSGRESYLSANIWQQLLGYMCLLFIWSPGDALPNVSWLPDYAAVVIASACFVLLIAGTRKVRQAAPNHRGESLRCPISVLAVAAGVAAVSIAAFAYVTFRKRAGFTWLNYRLWPILSCAALPLVALVADYVIRRCPLAFQKVALRLGAPLSFVWLVVMLAVVPVVILTLISFFVPLMALRTLAVFGPFLLIVISAGALYSFRPKSLRASVVIAIVALNLAGLVSYRKQLHSPDDYAAIAAKVGRQTKPDDLLFVFRHWAMTPIYYYLDSDSYNFVGHEHAGAIAERPDARVWVFGFDHLSPPERVTAPLDKHYRQARLQARGVYADLYVPLSGNSSPKTDPEKP